MNTKIRPADAAETNVRFTARRWLISLCAVLIICAGDTFYHVTRNKAHQLKTNETAQRCIDAALAKAYRYSPSVQNTHAVIEGEIERLDDIGESHVCLVAIVSRNDQKIFRFGVLLAPHGETIVSLLE